MLRYALYARKSKEDRSGTIKSIKDQLDVWRELAAVQGIQIKVELEENRSAKTPGTRPVYDSLIRDVEQRRIDAILVWHINRLARNMAEGGKLSQMLIDGQLKEIRTPSWTYKPGDNILPLLLEQGMSAQYSLDLSEAVKRGMNSLAAAGGWPHQAKIGYLNARDPANSKRGIIKNDPERFDLVRKGFDLMLTGAYNVRSAIDEMNRWGLQTRPTPSRPGGPLSYALGYDVFTSPFYAGFIRRNGIISKGVHAPMISAYEHNRLVGMIKRQKVRRKTQARSYAYTGLMECGYCGMQITAEQHFKSGKLRVYYHCSDPYGRCTKRGINEGDLEALIMAQLESIAITPEVHRIGLANISRWLGENSAAYDEVLQSQQNRLSEVDGERNNLLNMMVRGLLTDDEMYKRKDGELADERNSLLLEIEKAGQASEHVREQARRSLGFKCHAAAQFQAAEPDVKRAIVRALSLRYVLRGNDLTFEVHPLLEVAVCSIESKTMKLEPEENSSGSETSASFLSDCQDGRAPRRGLEPLPDLAGLLRDSEFPNIFSDPDCV